jgi:hypothetical protein
MMLLTLCAGSKSKAFTTEGTEVHGGKPLISRILRGTSRPVFDDLPAVLILLLVLVALDA